MDVPHILHRIYIIFEESDGRLWASGIDMMAPNLESAEVFADRLNEMLGVDRAAWPGLAWPGLAWPGLAWPALADRVFPADEAPDRRSD